MTCLNRGLFLWDNNKYKQAASELKKAAAQFKDNDLPADLSWTNLLLAGAMLDHMHTSEAC